MKETQSALAHRVAWFAGKAGAYRGRAELAGEQTKAIAHARPRTGSPVAHKKNREPDTLPPGAQLQGEGHPARDEVQLAPSVFLAITLDDRREVLAALAAQAHGLVQLLGQRAEDHWLVRLARGFSGQPQVLEHQLGAEAAGVAA